MQPHSNIFRFWGIFWIKPMKGILNIYRKTSRVFSI